MIRPTWLSLLTLTGFLVVAATSQTVAQEAVTDSVRKYKFLGKSARDKSDHADAVDYYSRLLTFKSDYHLAHYYIARAQLALGDQAAAKVALLSAVALKPRHANTLLLLYQV